MDIEGGEYDVILDTNNDILKKFRILVIEFHQLNNLIVESGFNLISLAFRKILKDFEIVHIHPNNWRKPILYGDYEIPPVIEVTFLRKDRIQKKYESHNFPHILDCANFELNTDFPLPKCWY